MNAATTYLSDPAVKRVVLLVEELNIVPLIDETLVHQVLSFYDDWITFTNPLATSDADIFMRHESLIWQGLTWFATRERVTSCKTFTSARVH